MIMTNIYNQDSPTEIRDIFFKGDPTKHGSKVSGDNKQSNAYSKDKNNFLKKKWR